MSLKSKLSSVLFWSVVSAAFIGPGTVTVAAKAGATYGLSLLWALTFSTIATIVLQEAAARLTIASGKNLGEIIAVKFKGGRKIAWLFFGAIAFGCAAYQAGNILGALSGLAFLTDISQQILSSLLVILAAAILWVGRIRIIARLLGTLVALMGITFIYVALKSGFSSREILPHLILPSIPQDGSLLLIALVGTTIVPYNLFLGSGISKGQSIQQMRWGLTLAVLIGGIISMAIVLVGTQVNGPFSFEVLADTLAGKLGGWAVGFFGFALFAAGMSSAITAPLAAAISAQSLLGPKNWEGNSRNFRLVWLTVLGIGFLFGMLEVKPIPAIILAQAINGILLPIVAIFLLLSVNDKSLMPVGHINSRWLNGITLLIVGLTIFLGLNNFFKAIYKSMGWQSSHFTIWLLLLCSFATMGFLLWKIQELRKKH